MFRQWLAPLRKTLRYFHAAWHIFVRRVPGYQVEELVLRASRTTSSR